ncbi:MAG: hypothetical protein AAB625_00925 [Patescibacteria group bacterium]
MEIDIAKVMFKAQNIFGIFMIIVLGILLLYYKRNTFSIKK